ncbi:MAG: MFS transporter [Rhodoplanes sp.]|uniref:MFS transporter n=1 Tax=Rhodoplanes sp. TaxID=1968906 RepID=UPI00182365D6|nr:MFS transporter [Rhodoplanes sp.]NVO17493.1 MFS transporter [Rhodoplanes sp.]
MDKSAIETGTIRRTMMVLVPFLMICYLVSFIDRVNVGFAAFQMNKDLGLTASVFGLGSGLFFLTYFIFEVPSNLALERFGARRWLARIMISWGLVSACTAFVVGPWSFYSVRLVLGAAEAGFFPGVILYLTYWFPAEYRARIVSMFYIAVPLSSFVGSPISASLLELEGWLGLHGWQWVFLIEGAPAVLLGFATLLALPDRPEGARWLSAEQRAWLTQRLADEARQARPVQAVRIWRVLFHPQVLLLAMVYAGSSAASNGLSLWQPQILKSFGLTNMQVGLVNSVPFALACVVMILWGRYSDSHRERIWSTTLPLGLSAVALGSCLFTTSLLPTVMLLSLTLIGTYSFKAPFWALSTETLSVGAAAAGLAQINAIGNLGGFGGTYLIGVIRDATGSYPLAVLPLVVLEFVGCIVVLVLGYRHKRGARAPAVAA